LADSGWVARAAGAGKADSRKKAAACGGRTVPEIADGREGTGGRNAPRTG